MFLLRRDLTVEYLKCNLLSKQLRKSSSLLNLKVLTLQHQFNVNTYLLSVLELKCVWSLLVKKSTLKSPKRGANGPSAASF